MSHDDEGLVSFVLQSILYIEWVVGTDNPHILASVVLALEALHLQRGGRVKTDCRASGYPSDLLYEAA